MEFIYDCETKTWTNHTLADGKTFVMRTTKKTSIDIPDFRQTLREQFPEQRPNEIKYYGELIPYFVHNRDEEIEYLYACNVDSGKWDRFVNNGPFRSESLNKLRQYLHGGCEIITNTFILNVMNKLEFDHEKRLQYLESLFHHIREKNSMLDEFLKTADEVCNGKSETSPTIQI